MYAPLLRLPLHPVLKLFFVEFYVRCNNIML